MKTLIALITAGVLSATAAVSYGPVVEAAHTAALTNDLKTVERLASANALMHSAETGYGTNNGVSYTDADRTRDVAALTGSIVNDILPCSINANFACQHPTTAYTVTGNGQTVVSCELASSCGGDVIDHIIVDTNAGTVRWIRFDHCKMLTLNPGSTGEVTDCPGFTNPSGDSEIAAVAAALGLNADQLTTAAGNITIAPDGTIQVPAA